MRTIMIKMLKIILMSSVVSSFIIFSGCSESQSRSEAKNLDNYELIIGDYPYNDIGSLPQVADPNTCKAACSQISACVGFVYNVLSRDCVFKSKMDVFKPSTEWQSYHRLNSSSFPFNEYPSLDFPGHDLGMLTAVSPDQCKSQCAAQALCVGFVYNPGGNYCHLKDQFAAPGVTTGSWITYAKPGVFVPMPNSSDHSAYPSIDSLDFPGSDIVAMMPATRQQCTERCDSLSSCVGFVFHKTMNYCHLKSQMLGSGTSNSVWEAFFKGGIDSYPGEPIPNPVLTDCIAVQVMAGKNLNELQWRREQLIQNGYDAYISQKPGTDIYRLRVRTTSSNASYVASQLRSYFGYDTWLTSCD